MALKIRLARGGAKKRPFFSIVVADSRSPRDGRFIEKLGTYNPMVDKGHAERLVMNAERVKHWLERGALPTDRIARFLGDAGLVKKPEIRETPKKSAPKAKAQERAKAASEAAGAAAGGGRLRLESDVPQSRVLLAIVTAPHGVKGLVRVKSFAEEPESLLRYGALEDERGAPVALSVVGLAKGVVLARIDGIADRDAAERVKGMRLYLPRAALPPTEPEEFYHADLLGLAAELADGTVLGRVRAVHNFGAGDNIEIAREDAASLIVPFTRAVVPAIELDKGRIVVAPPEGLIEPVREDAGAER